MKSKLFVLVLSLCISLMFISTSKVNASTLESSNFLQKKGITIEYFGQASFGIRDSEGMKIVTDPYDPMLGYNFPKVSTKILTVSHDHFDHNNISALKSYEKLIFGETGSFTNGNIKIKGLASWHDNEMGNLRGPNTIYTYEINKIKICHLGDLGHVLSPEQVNAIGQVDVLMIPVGGYFTMGSEEVMKVIKDINPRVVIPMHYGTEESRPVFEDTLAPVEDFTTRIQQQGWKVEKVDFLTLTKQKLNTLKCKKVFVLNYK